jgi:hypothetical protein
MGLFKRQAMLAGARVDDRVLGLGALGVGAKRAAEAMSTSTIRTSSSPFTAYEPRCETKRGHACETGRGKLSKTTKKAPPHYLPNPPFPTPTHSLVPDLRRLLHPHPDPDASSHTDHDNSSPSHDVTFILPAQHDGNDTVAAPNLRLPAHRCILAARSDKFGAMFEGRFSEGVTTSSSGGVNAPMQEVALPHWSAPAFRAFLSYAYTGEGPPLDPVMSEERAEEGEDGEEHVIAELLLLADECLVDSLRLVCEHALGRRLLRRRGTARVCVCAWFVGVGGRTCMYKRTASHLQTTYTHIHT